MCQSWCSVVKMRCLLLSAAALYFISSVSGYPQNYPQQGQMTDEQLEHLLHDKTAMQRHLKCALGQGPCDAISRRLRTLGPLVLRGSCPQCSAQEIRQIRKTLAHVQRNYPWEWSRIVRQYG